jgi:hypothetical protein
MSWEKKLHAGLFDVANGIPQLDGSGKLPESKLGSLSISKITGLQGELDNKVATSLTINGKSLTSNISLSAADVGARADTWLPTKGDIGLGNVENKSSATIRGELTKANVLDTGLSKTDIGLGNVENKSSATIRGELTKGDITGTNLHTGDITRTVTDLPASGEPGESVFYNDNEYVWVP